jgi:farnesyl diphosphate synthase
VSSVAATGAQLAQPEFGQWMRAIQDRIEVALSAALPSDMVEPVRLHQAMRYAVLGGGKRVRPLLAFAAGELSSAPVKSVERIAIALELIHAYSLVHDDLPCMDDDVLRRGRPTCHVQFDEATAMLAGDALQSEAMSVIVGAALADDPRKNAELLQLFAEACGARGMAGGQAIDLGAVGQPMTLEALERMHRMKTGALIRAAILMGAGSGAPLGTALQAQLSRYAEVIGLAFQVVDDILDVEVSSSDLGKTAGKDALQNKPTFVSILGLDAAKAKLNQLHAEARATMADAGIRARRLNEMTDFIILRRH